LGYQDFGSVSVNARVARENETLRKDRGSKCEAMQRSLDREWWVDEKVEISYECWTIANLKIEYVIVFSYQLNSTLLALSDKDPKSVKLEEMMLRSVSSRVFKKLYSTRLEFNLQVALPRDKLKLELRTST
jgi:hypothetical protein